MNVSNRPSIGVIGIGGHAGSIGYRLLPCSDRSCPWPLRMQITAARPLVTRRERGADVTTLRRNHPLACWSGRLGGCRGFSLSGLCRLDRHQLGVAADHARRAGVDLVEQR
jgi:hypothetical protein